MDRRYSYSPNIRFLILYQIDLYPVRNIPISLCSSAGMREPGMKYRELGIFDHGRTKSNLNFSLFGVCTGFTMKFPAQWFWQKLKLKIVQMQLIFQLKSISNQLQLIEITGYWQICVYKAIVIQPSIQSLNFVVICNYI